MIHLFHRVRAGLNGTWLWSGLLLAVLPGCGPSAVSPQTYELSKALYSACNLKQTDRLELIADLIESSLADSEITEVECQRLREAVALGEAGQWKVASELARRILEDQIGLSRDEESLNRLP